MQKRVGSVIPSEQDIQRLVKEVDSVGARLEKFALLLSTTERLHATKMRTNGAQIVTLVGDLVQRHEVSLPRVSVEHMRTDLLLAQRMAPLRQSLERVLQVVADTILQAQSECWWATTAFYSALTRLADADPELERALKPAVEFFARRQRPTPTAQS